MRAELRESGFTLVEMAVTVAVVGVLAVIAIPTFINIVPKTRLNSAVQTLANEIAMSRTSAIAKSTDYGIQFDPSSEQYKLGRYLSGTFTPYATTTLGSFADLESVKYKDGSAAPNTLQLTAMGATSVPLMNEYLYITLQTKDGFDKRRVVVWMTGRVATEKWTGTSWTIF